MKIINATRYTQETNTGLSCTVNTQEDGLVNTVSKMASHFFGEPEVSVLLLDNAPQLLQPDAIVRAGFSIPLNSITSCFLILIF